MTVRLLAAGASALALAAPAAAQQADAPLRHSIGADLSFSNDADDTNVLRLGLDADVRYRSTSDYLGIRLETNRYRPSGLLTETDRRVYLRAARPLGAWKAAATLGTDGHTLLGSASVHDEKPLRKEIFFERDKVETRQGVTRPIVYSFGGAAIDLPLATNSQLTLLGGLQAFTGDNVRTHLRANFIQVVKPDLGLSVQLRTRYFHNSVEREYDYYSPRWHAEILPVVQMRRFVGGWRYQGALGLGAQRNNASGWRQSRFANLRVASPENRRGWAVNGELTYSDLPVSAASDRYNYVRVSTGLARRF